MTPFRNKSVLTNRVFGGYNGAYSGKSCEEKSMSGYPVREPCQVEMGTVNTAEHGLGAEPSIGRRFRVRPLQRVEAKNVMILRFL